MIGAPPAFMIAWEIEGFPLVRPMIGVALYPGNARWRRLYSAFISNLLVGFISLYRIKVG
jgi:hypothetical protein